MLMALALLVLLMPPSNLHAVQLPTDAVHLDLRQPPSLAAAAAAAMVSTDAIHEVAMAYYTRYEVAILYSL
eukprot:COSAG02_NODE_4756_length_5022_cov_1.825107_7_plen_71_part_00